MNTVLERRLAWLIISAPHFTSDDLTDAGEIALDADHGPNGAQSGIGAFVQQAHRRRLIEWTGAAVKSKAPHRKGGMIRVWRGTTVGRLWARSILGKVVS